MSKLPPPISRNAGSTVANTVRGVYEAPMAEHFIMSKPITLLYSAYFSADATIDEYQEDSPETIAW